MTQEHGTKVRVIIPTGTEKRLEVLVAKHKEDVRQAVKAAMETAIKEGIPHGEKAVRDTKRR